MRILLHDYSGHPFQVQLSRELARRGHEVLHVYCSSYRTGTGALCRVEGDPAGFAVEPVDLGEPFDKYSFLRRVRQERRYGLGFREVAARFGPEVVVSANAPLLSQSLIQSWCVREQCRFIFWQQDVYSTAMRNAARSRLGSLGATLGRTFVEMERRMLRRSDAVVCISEDFVPVLRSWGIPPQLVTVVENWAPIEELPLREKDNPWAREHGLADRRVLLYSGTLGIKHNPELLLRLAQDQRDRTDTVVAVVSEGLGADWLRSRSRDLGLSNLMILPFQSFERFSEVLATGDVLLAILEADAGVFSVPSKVLTYHCAARPILAALPRENLAARLIRRNGSGIVVEPTDATAFLAGARSLIGDEALQVRMGERARSYAVRTFDIARIGDTFEEIVCGSGHAGIGA